MWCVERPRLPIEVVSESCPIVSIDPGFKQLIEKGTSAIRVDLIGTVSVFADDAGRLLAATPAGTARDVRVRVAARSRDRNEAERLAREVTALYCCGPAGGGGVRTALRPRLETLSCYVPRDAVEAGWEMVQ